MFNDPYPLPDSATIRGFTPDAALGWFAAYAGPCGCPENHTRLFLMPMIGWLHVLRTGTDHLEDLRPAVMSSAGTVIDYLRVPKPYQFIAIVPADEDAYDGAKEIYRQRFGPAAPLAHEDEGNLPVN